jgi:hypothetical protein
MTLDLSLIEHPQVHNTPPPIGYLKKLLNCHWLLLNTCVEIEKLGSNFYSRFYSCPRKVAVTFGCAYSAAGKAVFGCSSMTFKDRLGSGGPRSPETNGHGSR